MSLTYSQRMINLLIFFHRIEDDAALRAKVDEAMAVYDEYVKSQGGEASKDEPAKEEKNEEKA